MDKWEERPKIRAGELWLSLILCFVGPCGYLP